MKEPSVTGAGGGKERFRLGLSDGVRDTSRTHGTRDLESRQVQFHQQSEPGGPTAGETVLLETKQAFQKSGELRAEIPLGVWPC